jgi:hypothetical protein
MDPSQLPPPGRQASGPGTPSSLSAVGSNVASLHRDVIAAATAAVATTANGDGSASPFPLAVEDAFRAHLEARLRSGGGAADAGGADSHGNFPRSSRGTSPTSLGGIPPPPPRGATSFPPSTAATPSAAALPGAADATNGGKDGDRSFLDAAAALLAFEDQRRESWAAAAALDLSLTPMRYRDPSSAATMGSVDKGGSYLQPAGKNEASPPANPGLTRATSVASSIDARTSATSVPGYSRCASPSPTTRAPPASAVDFDPMSGSAPVGGGSLDTFPRQTTAVGTSAVDRQSPANNVYWLPETLVEIDQRDGAVMKDTVALITGWLQDRGFTATLGALRCESGLFARDEYLFRKALRSVAVAIGEGRWDAAHAAAKNLFATTLYRVQEQGKESGSVLGPVVLSATQTEMLLAQSQSGITPSAAAPNSTSGQQPSSTPAGPSGSATRDAAAAAQGNTGSGATGGTGGSSAALLSTTTMPASMQPAASLARLQAIPTAATFDVAAADRRVSAMMLEQQLLELVDAGDSAKAFSLFTKRVKPLESVMDPQTFQRLLYATTCRSVAEAAASNALCASLARWSVDGGRAALLALVRGELTASHVASEGHHGDTLASDTYISKHSTPVVPGQLHAMLEQAASFQALRGALAAGRLNLDGLGAEDRALLDDFSNPTRPPVPISRLLLPVHQQLPPLNVLKRVKLQLTGFVTAESATGAVCRLAYDASTRTFIIGTSEGHVATATVPSRASSVSDLCPSFAGSTTAANARSFAQAEMPLSPHGSSRVPLVTPRVIGQHRGAISGLAVPSHTAGARSSGVVVTTSLDGTARVWTPITFADGSAGYTPSLYRPSPEVGSSLGSAAITACGLANDASLTFLGDGAGSVFIYRTNAGAEPPNPKDNRHCRSEQQTSQPHLQQMFPSISSRDSPAQLDATHNDVGRPVPSLITGGSGSRNDLSAVLAPALLRAFALEPRFPGPPTGGASSFGAAVSSTQQQSGRGSGGTAVAHRRTASGSVTPPLNPRRGDAPRIAWGRSTIVAVAVSRHGLNALALQRSGVITCVSAALGATLRRFEAPDSAGGVADASCLAVTWSALHAFVGFGVRGDVRLLSLTDGAWRPDVFRVTHADQAGSSAQGSTRYHRRPGVTCLCLSDDDRFLLVGTTVGTVAVFSTMRSRSTAGSPASDAPLAAVDAELRVHMPCGHVAIGDSPVCDLRLVDRAILDTVRRAPTGDGYEDTLLLSGSAHTLTNEASLRLFGPTSTGRSVEYEARRFVAATTLGDIAFFSASAQLGAL